MYTIKIDDKSIDIAEGETVRVKGTFSNPQITLIVQPHCVFSSHGISFKYPREFSFEANTADEDYKNWTLSGNDFKIMIFVLNGNLTTQRYADSMIDRFGRQNCKVTNAALLRCGHLELSGTTIFMTIAGVKMVMDIYRIPSNDTQTKLLIMQDTLDSYGEGSVEGLSAFQLFKQSAIFEQ